MLTRVLGGAAASGLDRTVAKALFRQRSRTRALVEALGHSERLAHLEAIRSEYDRPEHFHDPDAFFTPPPRVALELASRRPRASRAGPVDVVDATWTSAFEPFSAGVAAAYLRHAENRRAAARLFLHRGGEARPVAVLVHGYRRGEWAFEERVWPVAWLLDAGVDVALPVLPFHAARAPRFRPALFPSSDPRFTVEGFRQAIADLRVLLAHLRARGATAAGVMGMSLGGFTASLLATVEPDLAFVVPMIPVASFADLARRSGRFHGDAHERAVQHAALEAALRVVSPMARAPRVEPERVLVVGAEADRIAPIDHARRLAAHFGAPLETMPGGHLLQLGRGEAFRAVGRLLGRLGLLA